MRVLVVGGGGREHALCWRLGASASVEEVVCAPGNAGIAEVARLRALDPLDGAAVVDAAVAEGVDLVVVGPEAPLVAGVADRLAAREVPVVGPSAAAARLESSKAFAKQVMAEASVPTAAAWSGSDVGGACTALDRFGAPYVVKADGLAAGKGVVVTVDRAEAEAAVCRALVDGPVVVEEHFDGPEVSLFALSDGETVVPLTAARDYKRARDGDEGPNTGGMGAFSPPREADALLDDACRTVFEPVVAVLRTRGTPYVGVLYAGMILPADGPRVLEFNARFGDPEAQVVLPRLRGDLGALLAACAHGQLGAVAPPAWTPRACAGVVLASGGYPGPHRTGLPISGLESLGDLADIAVFHAATRRDGDTVVTAGGRVLTVAALGDDVAAARAAAYRAADRVTFDGVHRRTDIAAGWS